MVETWIELIDRELELEQSAVVAVCVPVDDEPLVTVMPAEELP